MGLMFATRPPTDAEVKHIQLMLSTFRDGSGNEMEKNGQTRAGWREIERCIAEAVQGPTNDNKNVFDVHAPDDVNPNRVYGLSVKSKQITLKKLMELPTTSRAYMEIANSSAKFWDEIKRAHGYTQQNFNHKEFPNEIGNSLTRLVHQWHQAEKIIYESSHPGKFLDIENSFYLSVTYSAATEPNDRCYQLHAFSLNYPENLIWKYSSDRCLRAYDPEEPSEALIDWYGCSGGQLKYYPRGKTAKYSSPVFKLLKPSSKLTITEKAHLYFPTEIY